MTPSLFLTQTKSYCIAAVSQGVTTVFQVLKSSTKGSICFSIAPPGGGQFFLFLFFLARRGPSASPSMSFPHRFSWREFKMPSASAFCLPELYIKIRGPGPLHAVAPLAATSFYLLLKTNFTHFLGRQVQFFEKILCFSC